ncbi:MAG: hypothetical protein ACR2RE_31250, partial [Geminicoccaceae bacterium]
MKSKIATIVGTAGADVLNGTSDDDVFFTNGGGSDRIVLAGDEGAAIIASEFQPGSDVFDLSAAGISQGDVNIVDTGTAEQGGPNVGLGGLEVQIDAAELIAIPTAGDPNFPDLDRDFIFADDGENQNNAAAEETPEVEEQDRMLKTSPQLLR